MPSSLLANRLMLVLPVGPFASKLAPTRSLRCANEKGPARGLFHGRGTVRQALLLTVSRFTALAAGVWCSSWS
jgi:hypothetical protein